MSCCPPGFQFSSTLTPTVWSVAVSEPSSFRNIFKIFSCPAFSGVLTLSTFFVYFPSFFTTTVYFQESVADGKHTAVRPSNPVPPALLSAVAVILLALMAVFRSVWYTLSLTAKPVAMFSTYP